MKPQKVKSKNGYVANFRLPLDVYTSANKVRLREGKTWAEVLVPLLQAFANGKR